MSKQLPRHEARRSAFLLLFSLPFDEKPLEDILAEAKEQQQPVLDAYAEKVVRLYYEHATQVDEAIRSHLKDWTMERLPRTTLSILRTAITELLYGDENMTSISINEAVEFAKEYGAEKDYQFINGVLGAIAREQKSEEQANGATC